MITETGDHYSASQIHFSTLTLHAASFTLCGDGKLNDQIGSTITNVSPSYDHNVQQPSPKQPTKDNLYHSLFIIRRQSDQCSKLYCKTFRMYVLVPRCVRNNFRTTGPPLQFRTKRKIEQFRWKNLVLGLREHIYLLKTIRKRKSEASRQFFFYQTQ